MANEKKTGMSDEQKLFPQLIYRINSILSEIKSDLKYYYEGELFLAPSVLDPHTRTFNWLMVDNGSWKFDKRKDIENFVKSNWDKFEKQFINRIEMKTVSDAVNIVKNSTHVTVTDQKYHHALLSIYQFYPNAPRKYIDGILYRNIERRAKERKSKNHRIDYARAELLIKNESENKKTSILYPWVKIDFFNKENSESKYSCQEFNPSNPKECITEGYPADDKPDIDSEAEIKHLESENYYRDHGWCGFTPATERKDHFHKNYFVPFFVNDEGFDPNKFYKLLTNNLSERKFIYIKPLYDALYGEYGNLCAVLQIPFKTDPERTAFISTVGNIFINRLPFLVNEIKNAAFFEILKQPIEDDDLLEHYVKWLPMLQDWEKVMVWKIKENKSSAGICYCYTRRAEGGKETKWRKCENGKIKGEKDDEVNNEDCKLCKNGEEKSDYKKMECWVLKDETKSIQIAEKEFEDKTKHSNFKSLLEKIFTKKLIPELDPDDEAKYKNIRLVYTYPRYTVFPEDESENHRLAIFYERQQIDLLRQLALQQKVIKETVKHGTRTAIAAIMSREDSHNIGSHVLASLNQNEIRNRPRDVEKLMNYIQQRWDFIAGIIPGYPGWSEPLFFFSDIFNGFFEQGLLLDYLIKDDGVNGNIIRFHIKYKTCSITFVKKLFIRLVKNGQREEEEVELNVEDTKDLKSYDETYITCIKKIIKDKGKDGQINEIEVKFVPESPNDIEDILVDIPGGVVGCHAFYCILENIMRNAAKYSYKEKTGTFFEMFINIVDDSEDSNLFSIKISDSCSKENDHFKIADIQGKLKEDLVDRKGELVSEDWGIQVIKLGTKYLRAPCNEDTITVNAITEEKENGKYLAYKFEIRKPTLVTVADFNACVPEEKQTKGIKIKHVKDNNDLENLVKDFFSQLLIVLPKKDENEIKEILNYLARNNLKFPARILLCGKNEEHAKQIKKVLFALEKARTIPKRRFFVGKWWEPSFRKKWEDHFIIQAYKEWVWSFGEIKDPVNIVVYFDRAKEHKCFDRWRNLNDKTLRNFKLENSIKLSIYGKEKNGNDKVIKVVGEEFDKKNCENTIFFDNHGNGISLLNIDVDDLLHYHPIGSDIKRNGFNCRYIFDTLQNMSSGFSGVFTLLLLIESAITKVLIIDERVTESTVTTGGICQDEDTYIDTNLRLESLQSGRCFVPFFMRFENSDPKCLVKRFEGKVQHVKFDKPCTEGLWFRNNTLELKIFKISKNNIESIDQVDFVIIHRGVLETILHKTNFIDLSKSISPRVIITSGRANTNIKEGNNMKNAPFLEYSVLQQFIVREFSKYHLSRILFSVKGDSNND